MGIHLQKENNRIFSLNENGDIIAEITFPKKSEDKVDINHVFVHPSLRGKGVADELMQVAVHEIQSKDLRITASCPYAINWLSKHPEYSGFLDDHD